MLICDLHCVLSACEFTYKRGQLRLSIMVLANNEDSSKRIVWSSRACPAPLALRLQAEAESRSFACKVFAISAQRSLRTTVRDVLSAYTQRRIGTALVAHRAARLIVYEAGGLGNLYDDAGHQLQRLALKFYPSMSDIRKAERFAKLVRLSAYHALLAKDLGACH